MNKNIVLLGTSNSIKSGSYFKELELSQDISVISDVRVGDVPSTYFLSAERKLKNLALISKIDVIVIDSIINDVLMTESGVLDIAYLEKTFFELGGLFRECSNELPHIVLFNICPKAVEQSKSFYDVKKVRKDSLKKAGFHVSEVDILHSEFPHVYEDSDPLHHSVASSRLLVRKLCSAIEVESKKSSPVKSHCTTSLKSRYSDIGKYQSLKTSSNAGFFSSSLLTEPVCLVKPEEELIVSFDSPVNLLGLKFVASEDPTSLIEISIDSSEFYIPTASVYPKPLIRFCPFPHAINSKSIQKIKLRLVNTSLVKDSSSILKLPNAKIENSSCLNSTAVALAGLVTETKASESGTRLSVAKNNKKLTIAFDCFWPGFQANKDPIFGSLLQKNYEVTYTNDLKNADIVVVSWYSPDKPRKAKYKELKKSIRGKLVYYSAEHDGAGLEGEKQLDFDIFDHIFSHYVVENENHTWLPNYVRRHGVSVFSTVNSYYKRNINSTKSANIQFCYSNDNCEFRNRLFKKLDAKTSVDANGSLFNTTGYKLPRQHELYIKELAKYKFVIACENSSYPGYNTEKIVHALMAGSVPIYWGDPLIGSIWNEECFINLHDISMELCVESISDRGSEVFDNFRKRNAIPFPNAKEMEEKMSKSIFDAINRLFNH